MQCDLCQNEATVFLTQIVKDELKKMSLCKDCAREKGVTDPTGFALAQLLEGIGAATPAEAGGKAQVRPEERSCPRCGFTESQFKKIGRLGCSECYSVFREEVESLLRPMHAGSRHVGKVPAGLPRQAVARELMERLRRELEQAVARERYEEAAELRDRVRALEEELELEAGAPGGASEVQAG